MLWRDPGIWSLIATLFEGYLAEPSRAAARDWDVTRYAAYAWKCGHPDQARKIVSRLTGSLDTELFTTIAGEIYETVQAWIP